MNRRILAAVLSFLLLLCLSAVLAGNLDLLMTVGSEACTLSPAQLLLILSRIVDTFCTRALNVMPHPLESHSNAVA